MLARRIEAEEAHREVASGNALLVCAYDDQEQWRRHRLATALSFNEFQGLETRLAKNRKILFYCA